jgi:phosphate acetyltransferase
VKEVAEGLNISLDGIRVINPAESEDLDNFARRFFRLRREKGLRATEAREAMLQPNYYGTMMLAMHQADGLISGASHITGSVLRPLFQIIKAAPDIATVSSCMVMEVEDTRIGENGVLFMADCGVVPDPTVDQLADIAVTPRGWRATCSASGRAWRCCRFPPRAARRIRPSARCRPPPRMAKRKAEQLFLEADFDGELQVDAALVPEIAERKLHDSKVAGRANVLIFPDLNSGNIASKLVRLVGHANAYGQILLGLNRPAADVSRGSNAHDILGVAAIIGRAGD